MRGSITLRVALLAAALAFAANFMVMGFIYWRTHSDAGEALRREVTEQAAALADVYASGGAAALEGEVEDSAAAGDTLYFAGTLGADGRGRGGNVAALADGPRGVRPGYRTGGVRLRGRNREIEAGFVLRPVRGGLWLVSGHGFGERLALQSTLERSLLIAVALSVLLGLLCGLLVARYVGRRVAAIAGAADRITGGDLAHRVPVTGSGDAFDGLGRQINQMLDRIAALMGELRMLTDCLAHDLRSPVGRLRARVEAAARAPDEERDALLAGVVQEADALMRILATVLEIGRSEAMTSRNQFEWLDPRELIGELGEMYEPTAEEAGVALSAEAGPTPPLPLFGHRQLLAQALSNLLDNALTYGASGGEIVLFAEGGDGLLRLGVADRGPGIAPEAQAEARRRFGRLDSSRSVAGAGLGLALAEAVAHLHQGRLDLEDNGPGLKAVLCLPASPPTARSEAAPAPS
ncbi:MAG: HAMP domain-containing histidine kinase [Alphaproteobacteria bacterium]|nr:HAMP domain-containing histidine kinase [Alphaproteobacteria bacterium]MBV9371670.1 HAMP domain-containing histidine kinase [Alphaproteobacteria bacterium]MBV9900866.1 HAMP domain-containing histidine kinase [Alphaproteobacteria bacterium]